MFKGRCKLNEKIFEDVKRKEQVYWLGFFTTDGAVTENKVRLRLSCKGYSCLQKRKKFTGLTGKDYFCQRADACEVYSGSSKIRGDFAKYTITNEKTFTLKFPAEQLSETLLRYYMVGHFDEDNRIAKRTRKTVKPSIKVYTYDGREFSIDRTGNLYFP